MRLFIHPASPNCMMALMVLSELELEAEVEIVDLFAGQHQAPAFLAKNPNGLVPALEDSDLTLWETQAILIYLASRKPAAALFPDEARGRADVARWQFWSLAHWTPALQPFLFENYFKQLKGIGAPDEKRLEDAAAPFLKLAAILDHRLHGRDFLVGARLTLADIAAAGWLAYADQSRLPLDRFPHIRRWLGAISSLPSWREATRAWAPTSHA